MFSTKKVFDDFEKLWDEAEKKLDMHHFRLWLCGIYGVLIVRGNEEILKASRRGFESQLVHQEKEIKEERNE